MAKRTLPPTTWGDDFLRAYRLAREEDGITYLELAKRVSRVLPTTDTAILSLNKVPDIEAVTPRRRLLAWLCLTAMGYEPEDFGLNPSNTPLEAYSDQKLRRLLNRRSGWIAA